MWVVTQASNGVQRWTRSETSIGSRRTSSSTSVVPKPATTNRHVVKSYQTHDNGGRPFKVDIVTHANGSKDVIIYADAVDRSSLAWDDVTTKPKFTKLVKTYPKVARVFVGKSILNPDTRLSGGHGPKFDGNSILVNITGDKYVWIGWEIHEFTSPEPIEKFWSSVGNSDVPYPVAKSKSFAYFMLDLKYVPIERFETLRVATTSKTMNEAWSNLYSEFYNQHRRGTKGMNLNKSPTTRPKKLVGQKTIHKRLW